ncbi:MAG: tyrosine-type recombinase/integrase [Dorea sp.]
MFLHLRSDFTWRILLCTKKFLIKLQSAANKRNLKDSTIHAYCTSVAHFLNHTAKDIDALTTDDVDIFLTEKKLSGISPETYNHYHSGIRFFYKKILKKNWDDDDIPRMKRDRKLPTVLTKAEISAILDATPNLKHKAMIATMYSGGLRVSEVTHLHYDDISRTNKTIHIRDGKSRSDRYTLLADRTLEILDRILVSMRQTNRDSVPKFMDWRLSCER